MSGGRALRASRPLILEEMSRAPDGAGGWHGDWRQLGTVWGEVRPGTGRAVAAPGGPLSRLPLRIRVRAAPQGAPSRPVAGQRFRDGARLYAIRAVTEDGPDARWLLCMAEEETTP